MLKRSILVEKLKRQKSMSITASLSMIPSFVKQ